MSLFSDLVHHHIYRGVEVPLTARAYDYVLAGNGLFKRARSPYLAARVPVTFAHVAGLPDLEPALQLAIRPGLIPGRLLYTVLTDARRRAYAGREQMYRFQFAGSLIRIIKPDQEAGAASVHYDATDQDGVICDLHSHHTMRAFFSATDDCDENSFRFYAVVGQVLACPEIRLRLGMYGDFVSLPMTALFTGAGPFVDLYQTEVNHDGG